MSRTWVYSTMTGDSTLMALIPGGVHASTSLDKTPELKPFIMYRVASDRPDLRGDDDDRAASQVFLIFVHTKPGSYAPIDAILDRLRVLFSRSNPQTGTTTRSFWLENSDDFRDDDMGTIMKYMRIQVMYQP